MRLFSIHSNIHSQLYQHLILTTWLCKLQNIIQKEMEKQLPQSKVEFKMPKRYAKSNDLRNRLFEVGLNNSPKKIITPFLHNQMGTPKNRLQTKHPLAQLHKQHSAQLLRYQPQHSPTMLKTHGKDFNIRKNLKLPFSPKPSSNSHTVSGFFPSETNRKDQYELRDTLYEAREKQQQFDACLEIKESEQSKLDDYVSLILKGVDKIQQFLYLVRGSEDNIYQLELVNFEKIRVHEGEPNYEYYTVSKKGFCRYVGGKPQNFLEIADWAQQKQLYSKIKSLKFFYRFRRWKTLQMWRRTITRQRREAISTSLQEKLFLLEPTTRKTLIQLRKLTIEMEKSVLIIARNQGSYTLESFKHCQQRARREASLAVQQYSRQSRSVVRKCFDSRLTELRENIKKTLSQEKQTGTPSNSNQSPKQSAFQALGFPSKMSYEHRSKLRKETGKFLRFSYLVDNLHLSCLADLYSTQVNAFITRLEELQLQEPIKLRATIQEGKDQINNERIFALQLTCNFKEVPSRLISELKEKEGFMPVRDIRLKGQAQSDSLWVYRLAEHWLSLQPNIEEVLDELTFLLREGLSSLKCFERWSKHRQMQKYVSILEQWDDLVSQHWQISQNDNLDPLIIIDNIDPILGRLKNVLKVTETKLNDTISNILTPLLNAYWQYQRLDIQKLENVELLNPAETIEQFLVNTTKLLEKVTQDIPHRMELGIIILHVTRVKNIIGQKFATIIEKLKLRLPELVEGRTSVLNEWLTLYGSRLREQILNIDDYVRTVNVIREAEQEFGSRRDECSELSQMYQTMHQFKMDTRRRKDFETVTLKLKDHLDQLIISAEQNIERKSDLYTKEVIRYHLPNLLKDVNKALQAVEQPRFLELSDKRQDVLAELQTLQRREKQLIDQNQRCSSYMGALKLTHQPVDSLEQLSLKIKDRVTLWETLQEWQKFAEDCAPDIVKDTQMSIIIEEVERYREIILELEKNLPPNEVLAALKQKNNQFYINVPLLQGLSQPLSDSHWNDIYDVLPEKFSLDLKKRQFTMQQFLNSKAGDYSKQIQDIFEKSRVEARLQYKYQLLEDQWNNLTAKIKVEGRFNLISNGPSLREDLNKVLLLMTQNLADPFCQSLKMYSITYESLLSSQQILDEWLSIQDRLTELEKLCKLLDIKKLPEYTHFENAERLYKQISKITLIKGSESGVKLGKLLSSVTEDKLSQISTNMSVVEGIIKNILIEHRKAFPTFYLFKDEALIKLITENTHENIEQAAKFLFPGLKELQFENERITALITIDDDRLIKNPISINSEIEQILYQLSDTMSELHRRTMRMCRYKAIENNLTSMIDQYNIQHLLAISRVDFSHYTTISIENQQQSPQSLAQFRRVMRKDTAQDIRNRQFIKQIKSSHDTVSSSHIQKYDTLLLQQLVYEEILDQLIKKNIQYVEEFIWASQLKFYWEDSTTDEPNITIKQLHMNLKYGNEFLGSITKVIIQNEPELLLGLKLNENVVYTGSQYNLERLFNAIGYKMLTLFCSPETTRDELSKFLIGCYFSDYLPILCSADLLRPQVKYSFDYQEVINQFKTTSLKKNSPYFKQLDKTSTLFTLLRDTTTNAHSFSQSFRVVNYKPPKSDILKSGMQLMGIFSPEKNSLLLRIFELIRFLEERSEIQGVALEKFLDQTIKEEAHLDQYRLFSRLLAHLKPCIAVETHVALTKHLENLGLVTLQESGQRDSRNKMAQIIECMWQRGVVLIGGRGESKKYFLDQQLSKQNIKPIEVFGKSIPISKLFASSMISFLVGQHPSQSKHVFYFKEVTVQLLLSFEKMVFYDKQLQNYKGKFAVVLDIPVLDKFIDPHAVHSFPIFHFQQPKQHIDNLFNSWAVKNVAEDKQKPTIKAFQQIVLPCIEALNIREELVIQSKFSYFLKYYSCLLPVSNINEACIYTLALMHRGSEQELLKLDYLTKKQLPEEYFSENTHLSQLVFCKHLPKQRMLNQKQYLNHFVEQHQFKDRELILTPEYAHILMITRRIHNYGAYGVYFEGKGNSGKSTLLKIYRQLHHQNSFYLTITSQQHHQWNQKINKTLHHHGLNLLGSRINYKETIIMVEDVHMVTEQTFEPIHQMLAYNKWQKNDLEYSLKNIKFILTGQQIQHSLLQNALKVNVSTDNQKLKTIFGLLLNQCIDKEWNIPSQMFNKMASETLDIAKKVTEEKDGYLKQTFTVVKRVIMSFSFLKHKEYPNPIKQVEKYLSYALCESLRSYNNTILQAQLKAYELTRTPQLNYTHLFAKPLEKKLEQIKDNKRIFNLLNERIEKYNESEVKRYGDNFEFINFDSFLEKVLSISHSILMEQDHMLVGRKGAGKQSLIKLAAFFNGLHFKIVEGDIKSAVLELFEGIAPAPHLFLKKISNKDDATSLEEYCECDFESQILGQCQSKPRVGTRQKEKEKAPMAMMKTARKEHNLSDTYTMPKIKPTYEEVSMNKKNIRLATTLSSATFSLVEKSLRKHFYIDVCSEVPTASIIQYNQKLLDVDGITCSKDSQILISQIYEYSRQAYGISLRGNDDCVRLFSSFISNLIPEMTAESQRFSRILSLLQKLRTANVIINQGMEECHLKLKEISKQMQIDRDQKAQIEHELREKSTALAVNQKLTQILSWLEPNYLQKHQKYQQFLEDRSRLELIFAVTASYFIYLSNCSYQQRRKVLSEWYQNISMMKDLPKIQSFLPLFLLSEEQFNAEPVDEAPDFYENMAIIFHSAKPVAIRDQCQRGKQWLEKNCSFVNLRQNQKDFIEQLSQHLTKPTNILIEVTNQDTILNLNDTPIGTLLFLPESVTSVTLQNQEVLVHQQAKVYMLLAPHIVLPKQVEAEFTVVLFQQNFQISKKAFIHEYLSCVHREHQYTKLDYHRKLRNIKLDCQNVMSQVAENLYEQLIGEQQLNEIDLLELLAKVNDKVMIKAQNQFTKVREKQDIARDCQEKYAIVSAKIEPECGEDFHLACQKILEILRLMDSRIEQKIWKPNYPQFFHTIRNALLKGFVTNIPSLLLFTLRQWGPMYNQREYVIFSLLLVMVYHDRSIQELYACLTPDGITKGCLLQLIKRPVVDILDFESIEQEIAEAFVQIFRKEQWLTISPFVKSKQNLCEPLLWLNEQGDSFQKIVQLLTNKKHQELRQKLIADTIKIIEPTQQDSLQSLLKKNQNEHIYVLTFSPTIIPEYERILKHWNLREQSTIMLKGQNVLNNIWSSNIENSQKIFKIIIETYMSEQAPPQLEKKVQIEVVEVRNQSARQSHQSSLNTTQIQQQLDLAEDKTFRFMQNFARVIRKIYSKQELPIPLLTRNELVLLRKSLENTEIPLPLQEKVASIISYIKVTLVPMPQLLLVYFNNLFSKIIKASCKSIEDDFFLESQVILSQYIVIEESHHEERIKIMQMELGWLSSLRSFIGIDNDSLTSHYIKKLSQYINAYDRCQQQPTISRSVKRHTNLKNMKVKKQFMTKKHRQSIKRNPGKQQSAIEKHARSQLSSILLLKQSQNYETMLTKIHKDLLDCKNQLERHNEIPKDEILLNLIYIMQETPAPCWKPMLMQFGCNSNRLEEALTGLLEKRNELFTLYNKFNVSDSCEIEMRYMKKPDEFLKTYFGTQFNTKDGFLLSTQLTPQQTERQYLKIVGLWSSGWRLSAEGVMEYIGEGKINQLGACYLIKKQVEATGTCPIDVSVNSTSPAFMRAHVLSKKMVPSLKMFMHSTS